MGRDFYKTLGVDRNATADEIKRAYRQLTKQFHPDRNPNDPEAERRFKEVQEAYEILGDKDKRADYDQFGDAAVGHVETGPTGQRVYTWGGGTQIPVDDLEDLFTAFGGGASVAGRARTRAWVARFSGANSRSSWQPMQPRWSPARTQVQARMVCTTFPSASRV